MARLCANLAKFRELRMCFSTGGTTLLSSLEELCYSSSNVHRY